MCIEEPPGKTSRFKTTTDYAGELFNSNTRDFNIVVPTASTRTDSCCTCRAATIFRKKPKFSAVLDQRFSVSFRRSIHYFLILNLAILPVIAKLLGHAVPHSIGPANACRPGGSGRNRLVPRKMIPITFRQHVPNVSEKTIGASGPTEGKIMRDSKRFREELIRNLNPDIVFKDEEQTNADRMMTERCRDRLNRLAMMVSEHWKNQVKLRVTEAWDEDGVHEPDSLHYEGRAVDITTTDRDRSKYGMLARLAVEAGFDWVFYESRAHVHCSVKADKSDAARYGGCFSGDTRVSRPDGTTLRMAELRAGDAVLSVDEKGNVLPDRILTFMDRRTRNADPILFTQIQTEGGDQITMTASHLIRVLSAKELASLLPNSDMGEVISRAQFIYAKSAEVGDYVFKTAMHPNNVNTSSPTVTLQRVTSIRDIYSHSGAFAPLTERGTILVNRLVTSCYAVIESHNVAHLALTPLRYFHIGGRWLGSSLEQDELQEGVSWYPKLLFHFRTFILPESLLHK